MRKLVWLAFAITALVLALPLATVCADVSVGVKSGDWIQYNVNVTGNPPGDHNIAWASMNVTDVQGTAIELDVLTLFNNGTLYPEHITLNLVTGFLGDDFFIPPNLNVGDQFYDNYQGNITITGIDQQTVAGAQRTVVLGSTKYTDYVWDQATGTLVAATSNETDPPQYYMVTTTNSTNIWPPETLRTEIFGFPLSTFYAVFAACLIVAVAIAVVSGIWIRQRKTQPLLLALEIIGAAFVAVFLAAYLGGMLMTPSTTVLHSEPAFRIALFVLGVAFLILILANFILAKLVKSTPKNTALRIGLLIVAAAYFLFNLHSLFTLEWIGEWNRVGGGFSTPIFVQDITNFVGIITRFIAGVIAIVAVIYYFRKGWPSPRKGYKVLRWILVLEAIYWISLLPQAGITVIYAFSPRVASSTLNLLSYLASTAIPTIVESIAPTIALLVLASKLSPNKPQQTAIKWALITGAVYVFVFWLTNTGAWIQAIDVKGTAYLVSYPQHLLSVAITVGGLLVLALYAVYYYKKNNATLNWQEINLRGAGIIITLLGLYFLWNYLSWIFFGGNQLWSSWYAWFLGHNLDLWMLSLPLFGVPLLFVVARKIEDQVQSG